MVEFPSLDAIHHSRSAAQQPTIANSSVDTTPLRSTESGTAHGSCGVMTRRALCDRPGPLPPGPRRCRGAPRRPRNGHAASRCGGRALLAVRDEVVPRPSAGQEGIPQGIGDLRSPAPALSELSARAPTSATNMRRSSLVSNLRVGAGKTGLDAVWTSSPEF